MGKTVLIDQEDFDWLKKIEKLARALHRDAAIPFCTYTLMALDEAFKEHDKKKTDSA